MLERRIANLRARAIAAAPRSGCGPRQGSMPAEALLGSRRTTARCAEESCAPIAERLGPASLMRANRARLAIRIGKGEVKHPHADEQEQRRRPGPPQSARELARCVEVPGESHQPSRATAERRLIFGDELRDAALGQSRLQSGVKTKASSGCCSSEVAPLRAMPLAAPRRLQPTARIDPAARTARAIRAARGEERRQGQAAPRASPRRPQIAARSRSLSRSARDVVEQQRLHSGLTDPACEWPAASRRASIWRGAAATTHTPLRAGQA